MTQRRLLSWIRIIIIPERPWTGNEYTARLFHLPEGAPLSSEELYGAPSLHSRRCASSCGSGCGCEAPLFHRLVNRNNCVQKLRGTLIVTWQANRIDTPCRRRSLLTLIHPGPFVRSAGYYQISLRWIQPAKYVHPVSRSCSGRMHGARNELPRPVNYAPSLPIRVTMCRAVY